MPFRAGLQFFGELVQGAGYEVLVAERDEGETLGRDGGSEILYMEESDAMSPAHENSAQGTQRVYRARYGRAEYSEMRQSAFTLLSP